MQTDFTDSSILVSKPCQLSGDSTRHTIQEMCPDAKIQDVQDVGKSSKMVDTWIHINSQVSQPFPNILASKAFPVCQNDNKAGLGVEVKNNNHDTIIHVLLYNHVEYHADAMITPWDSKLLP